METFSEIALSGLYAFEIQTFIDLHIIRATKKQ